MPAVVGREPKAADSAGAGQAMEAVRHTEALLAALAAEPAPVLRSGGVGVRELRRLAKSAGLDEPLAALLLEVASAAGLAGELEVTGRRSRSAGPPSTARSCPPPRYDAWRVASIARRWDRPGRGVAGDDPPARARRAARRAGPADQRAVAGGGTQRRAGRPAGGARGARRPGPGRRAHRRRGARAAGLAGAPAQPWPGDRPTARRSPRRPCSASPGWARSRRTAGCCTPTTRPPPAPGWSPRRTRSACAPAPTAPPTPRRPPSPRSTRCCRRRWTTSWCRRT